MPTFDFQCTACDHVWEFSRPFGSKETPSCPDCGGKDVKKLITPPAIQFKGEGFYKTDATSKSAKSTPRKDEEKNDAKNDKKTNDTDGGDKKTSPSEKGKASNSASSDSASNK